MGLLEEFSIVYSELECQVLHSAVILQIFLSEIMYGLVGMLGLYILSMDHRLL